MAAAMMGKAVQEAQEGMIQKGKRYVVNASRLDGFTRSQLPVFLSSLPELTLRSPASLSV